MILLVIWSVNGNGIVVSFKGQNNNYRGIWATVIMPSFGQIEKGVYYIRKSLIYNKESVSGESSGRYSL